jgi:hypothetical protein
LFLNISVISKKIFGFGLAAIGLAIFLTLTFRKQAPIPVESPTVVSSGGSNQIASVARKRTMINSTPTPSKDFPDETEAIEDKILNLQEIATSGDPESFQTIISELTNQNPEIRQAALEAIIQFGSQDAIPILKDLAEKTEDAHEKVSVLDAIKFLSLPPFSEVKQTRRTNNSSAKP